MAEYLVLVHFDGVGRVKVRAESASQAWEDAQQMDSEDIEWDSFTIQPTTITEESP